MTDPNIIRPAVIAALARSGESVRSLAARAGVHYPKLTQWLNGKRGANVDTAERVMRACGLEVKQEKP